MTPRRRNPPGRCSVPAGPLQLPPTSSLSVCEPGDCTTEVPAQIVISCSLIRRCASQQKRQRSSSKSPLHVATSSRKERCAFSGTETGTMSQGHCLLQFHIVPIVGPERRDQASVTSSVMPAPHHPPLTNPPRTSRGKGARG